MRILAIIGFFVGGAALIRYFEAKRAKKRVNKHNNELNKPKSYT